ncbi:MAG: penicillin-binding protein 2 [Oligoflexia bacterium]|nr:penicillin-binding protein 2 [Oligoflexia bacterium]
MSPIDWVENSEDVKEYSDRFRFFYVAVGIAFAILFLRLWYLQIIRGTELRRFSEQNQLKEEKIPAPRGMLLDRNGELLVDNLPNFIVTLTPQHVVGLDQVAGQLATILSLKKEDIIEDVKQSRKQNGMFKPVIIKENISRDEVAAVERIKFDTPGLRVVMGIKRNYLDGENGAQIFGYTGEVSKQELPVLNRSRTADNKLKAGDVIGKAGLEKRWDPELRGVDGAKFVSVDAREREIQVGRDLLGGYPDAADYVPGKNITLTIDKDLQRDGYESMKRNNLMGSVVALDPNSGEILTMLNLPSFNPNHFSTGIPPEIWTKLVNDPFKPLRNKAIQDHYPPASTFKTVVGLAALQEGVINLNTSYNCTGLLRFGRRDYHCWVKHGHGRVNFFEALERSCDVFFYQVALNLGIDKISKYARRLGMGSRTGIPLDNERSGLVPDTEWKKKTLGEEWQPGENLSNAIGQGFMLITPLQLAVTYATIGTDGKVYQPFLVKNVKDTDGKTIFEGTPRLLRNVQEAGSTNEPQVTKETFEHVKKALSLVFQGGHGTAGRYRIPGINIGGKTGTAQLFQLSKEQVYMKCENRELKQRHNGWLAAFAPIDNPRIDVVVHSEHSCHGTAGGPVVKDLLISYFRKYEPDLLKDLDKKIGTVPIVHEGDE